MKGTGVFHHYWAYLQKEISLNNPRILIHFNKGIINVTFLSRSSSNVGYVAGIVVTGLLAVLSIVFAVVICCVPNVRQWISEHLSKKGNVPSTFYFFLIETKSGLTYVILLASTSLFYLRVCSGSAFMTISIILPFFFSKHVSMMLNGVTDLIIRICCWRITWG